METTFSFQMPQEARVFSEALNRMDALAEQTGAAADTIHQAMRYMQQSQQYSLEGRKMLAEIETSTQEWEGMGSQFRGLVEHVDALSLQSVHMKNLLMEFRVLGLNAAIAAAKAGDGHSWMQMAERWTTLAVVAEAQWATVQSRVSESTREVGRLAAYAQERVQVVQESSQKFDSTFTAITASLAVAAETFTELAIVSSAQESEMKAVRQAMQEWSAS